jgi:hypothetical protein
MSMLARTNELSPGNQMYGTDGYLHQCSLDRDHVCLEGERSSNDKCCFGSFRLSGMQNVWRNLYARSLFFCQIRNQFFLKRHFFQRSGQKMKIEVVYSNQMTLLQWCMNMNKGFCSFPISQKINRLEFGFALDVD